MNAASAAAAEDDGDDDEEAEAKAGKRDGERSNCHCHSQWFLLLLPKTAPHPDPRVFVISQKGRRRDVRRSSHRHHHGIKTHPL